MSLLLTPFHYAPRIVNVSKRGTQRERISLRGIKLNKVRPWYCKPYNRIINHFQLTSQYFLNFRTFLTLVKIHTSILRL
jgi:hypothetical protein